MKDSLNMFEAQTNAVKAVTSRQKGGFPWFFIFVFILVVLGIYLSLKLGYVELPQNYMDFLKNLGIL